METLVEIAFCLGILTVVGMLPIGSVYPSLLDTTSLLGTYSYAELLVDANVYIMCISLWIRASAKRK